MVVEETHSSGEQTPEGATPPVEANPARGSSIDDTTTPAANEPTGEPTPSAPSESSASADGAAAPESPSSPPDVSGSAEDHAQNETVEPGTLDDLDLSELDEPTADLGVSQSIIQDLRRDLEGVKQQLEERSNQYARLCADFENFRKRTSKERDELEDRVKCDTIRELLTVVDNFERARSLIKPQTDGELTIHKSYQGIYKQLVDGLKRLGVSPMRPEGQPFDPNLHEAVMRAPTSDHPEDTVLEELQRGYILGERVLRHAMVKVAAPPDGVVASEEA